MQGFGVASRSRSGDVQAMPVQDGGENLNDGAVKGKGRDTGQVQDAVRIIGTDLF